MSYKILILLFLGLLSCKKKDKLAVQNESPNPFELSVEKEKLSHADGFELHHHKGYTELIIRSLLPEAIASEHYILVEDKSILAYTDFVKGTKFIDVPVKKMVVTSTTHIPMLELLNEENALVGFPNSKYISSPKTRALIDANKVKELGKEENINTELLLDLQPDLVVGFSLNTNNKMFANIEKSGIPVILNGDWLEKTPLGRAEWIKFFGALFHKKKQADSIFNSIESKYLKAKKMALKSKTKPKVLSGILFKDKWNLPAGESFGAQFLRDANVDYPWFDSKGKGSLSLSFETVFDKAKDSDIWLNPGFFNSYNQLADSNKHYRAFDAFKHEKIYNYTNKKGATGGVLYYELAPVQPHIVLQDIIKIVHPELMPDYKPFYLEELKE